MRRAAQHAFPYEGKVGPKGSDEVEKKHPLPTAIISRSSTSSVIASLHAQRCQLPLIGEAMRRGRFAPSGLFRLQQAGGRLQPLRCVFKPADGCRPYFFKNLFIIRAIGG